MTKKVQMSQHMMMFYQVLSLQHEVKHFKNVIRHVETFYDTMLAKLCKDIPECKELSTFRAAHSHKIQSILSTLGVSDPKLGGYLDKIHMSSERVVLSELKEHGINLKQLKLLSKPNLLPNQLNKIVDDIIKSIKIKSQVSIPTKHVGYTLPKSNVSVYKYVEGTSLGMLAGGIVIMYRELALAGVTLGGSTVLGCGVVADTAAVAIGYASGLYTAVGFAAKTVKSSLFAPSAAVKTAKDWVVGQPITKMIKKSKKRKK
jgi:hypothetical protein